MTRAQIEAAIVKNKAERSKLSKRIDALFTEWTKLDAALHRVKVRALVGKQVRLQRPGCAKTRAWRATLVEVRRSRGTAVEASGKRWNVTLDQVIAADDEPGMSIRIGGLR